MEITPKAGVISINRTYPNNSQKERFSCRGNSWRRRAAWEFFNGVPAEYCPYSI